MEMIDNFLDKITMYRLVLYYLILLLVIALIYTFLGVLPFSPLSLIISTLFIVAVSWVTNKIFAITFRVSTNFESVYISALILALIASPAKTFTDYAFLFWAAVLAMASKYILAINKKHLFNPVAVAVAITALASIGSASWWVGTGSMLPFLLLGFLIVRKIRRFDLVYYFFLAVLLTMFGFTILQGGNLVSSLRDVLLSSSLFFFAFVMLTEPLTTPPTKKLQTIYGLLVGIMFVPQFHIGAFYTTPELALVVGNLYAYIVSPKYKIMTTLKQKLQVAPDMIDFLFVTGKNFNFAPGQYMEWTVPHAHPDSRGNRRYFTLASSPTENIQRLGIRFYPNGSSFKKAMLSMDVSTPLIGSQLSGDFTLPDNVNTKLVFMAGGIGITPFRSMLKYLVDMKQKRPIVMFYSNKVYNEIIYTDVFNDAYTQLGIKTVYTLTDKNKLPANWKGKVGRIDADMIAQEVPDYKERTFYLSGPHSMVVGYEEVLKGMGIPEKQIKKDFFPGFA